MQNEIQNLTGDWQALSGVLAGEPLPEEVVQATTLSLSETEYVVNLAGNLDQGACQIDTDSDPIRIRIEGQRGPNSGKTYLAILEFVTADEIRIAYDLSGTTYPTSFTPTSVPSSYVATFERN